MALWDHLKELKNRLIKSGIGVLIGAVGGWMIYNPLLAALKEPVDRISQQTGGVSSVNFSNIGSAFDFQVQMSLVIGLVISSPIWIYQLWAFITPGLTSKERRYTLGYMTAAVPLFLAGIWAGWLVVPQVVRALTQFTPAGFSNIIDARDYIDFVTRMVLVLGFAFLVPVVLVGVNMAGVVPVIFASSLLYLPALIAQFNLPSDGSAAQFSVGFMSVLAGVLLAGQVFKDTVMRAGDPDRITDGVPLAGAEASGAADDRCQLGGALDRPCRGDRTSDGAGPRFLAIILEDPRDLGLAGLVEELGGGQAGLAHAHVERTVGLEGKAAVRPIQLHRRHADIERDAIDQADAAFRQHPVHL